MATLGDRVRDLLIAKGWSQQKLADEVTREGFKIGQSGIGNIVSKGDSEPKCIVQLAAALGVDATWLQTGKGDTAPAVEFRADSPVSGRPDVPLWASAQAGDDGEIILVPDPIDQLHRSSRLVGVRNPFAFYVRGHSMGRVIRQGDQVVINPQIPVRHDTECVFIQEQPDGTMRALVKELRRITADHWRVKQYEPPREFDLSRKKWPRAYVISEIRRGGL